MYCVVEVDIPSDLLMASHRVLKLGEHSKNDIAVQKCSALLISNKVNDLQQVISAMG